MAEVATLSSDYWEQTLVFRFLSSQCTISIVEAASRTEMAVGAPVLTTTIQAASRKKGEGQKGRTFQLSHPTLNRLFWLPFLVASTCTSLTSFCCRGG